MHYGAFPSVFEKARELRNNPTKAEEELWKRVSHNQLGLKFRRQHPLSCFIADFYCHKANLVIEVDGKIHDNAEIKNKDMGRTYEIESLGIKILRFTNEDVLGNIEEVLKAVRIELKNKPI